MAISNRGLSTRLIPVAGASARKVHGRVRTNRSERLINVGSLVRSLDDLPGEASIGIATLDDFIGLQHADQLDRLPEAADIAFLRKHGEIDVRMNVVARVMLYVAKLTADDSDRPAYGSLHFDVDHRHGSRPSRNIPSPNMFGTGAWMRHDWRTRAEVCHDNLAR